MIAGLPGTGLGGVFYFLAALLLVVREGVRALRRGKLKRRNLVASMVVMLAGIMVALGITYWLLGLVLPNSLVAQANAPVSVVTGKPVGEQVNLAGLFVATLPVQLASVAALLMGIELLRLVTRWRGREPGASQATAVVLTEQAQRRRDER